MAAGINSAGVLPIGNLPATSSVALGAGGALTVDNTVSPPTVIATGSFVVTGPTFLPAYSIRATKTANQTISSNTLTAVTWDALSAGGGAVNFPGFSAGASAFTIPVAGTYLIAAAVTWATSVAVAPVRAWIDLGAAPIRTTSLWGLALAAAATVGPVSTSPVTMFRFSGGEQVRIGVRNNTGFSLALSATAFQGQMSLSIIRLGS